MRAVRAGRAALFLRSKRCARASFAVASRHAFRQAKAAWPAAKRARIFEARHSFLIPGTGLKRRSPQRALPPLKGRLLHAAFSSSRTPRENRPPISPCAPPFHPLLFAFKALPLRVIRRCFKARIPTGESGMACRKARSNFRAAFPPLTLTSERLQSHPPRSRLKPFTPRCTLFAKPAGARILPAISLYAPPPPFQPLPLTQTLL